MGGKYDPSAPATNSSTAFLTRGQFSRMHALGLADDSWGGHMLARACLFQTLDDDAAADRWFRSDRVRILNPIPYPSQYSRVSTLRRAMFEETDLELLSAMTGPTALALNLNATFGTGAELESMTRWDWWCKPCTWHQVITSIGVNDNEFCMESEAESGQIEGTNESLKKQK